MTAVIDKLLHPKSVAIIGMSSKPGSPGHVVLGNLKLNDFSGQIYLVGRSGGEVEGHPVLATVDDLPARRRSRCLHSAGRRREGSIGGCVGARCGRWLFLASGFAEFGNRDAQETLCEDRA